MKAVFPSKGVVVLTKNDVDKLHNFYKDNLINSKLFSVYEQSNYSVQVGSFSYLPKKSNIILDNANLLTLKQLYEILCKQLAVTSTNSDAEKNMDYTKPLDDNFILNHPFFETLKPLE